MEQKLCPRCGAYWACDCESSEPASPIAELTIPAGDGCNHDWTEVVGVEIDNGTNDETVRVLGCRLCGLYAVRVVS